MGYESMTTFSPMDGLPPLEQPIEVNHPKVMKSGVFFGMSDEEYHGALALSASGIKKLRVAPPEWWAECRALNPNYEEIEDTDAKAYGRAYDKRIIEGRAAFLAKYAPEWRPDPNGPPLLFTNDDLKEECRARGLAVSGTKEVLLDRLLSADPTIRDRLADAQKRDYYRQNEGKEFLNDKAIRKIEIAAAMIERHPDLGRAFTGGVPHVAIFWVDKETGVPCKSQLDYLKPRAIVDLKTVGNPLNKPADVAVRGNIATYGYHIQAAMYVRAVREACKMIRAGNVTGAVDPAFLQSLLAVKDEDRKFLFVFQSKSASQYARGYVMERGTVFGAGDDIVYQSLQIWAQNWRTFGPEMWVDMAPVTTFRDEDFPYYISE